MVREGPAMSPDARTSFARYVVWLPVFAAASFGYVKPVLSPGRSVRPSRRLLKSTPPWHVPRTRRMDAN